MEGDNVEVSTGGGTPASSRWNPTKEQISMLEILYKQGIRTPSAEQIQQITGRLKAYGHIEGKNVFYWFQNHKARQRQKQKQESLAYLIRCFHKAAPVFPPPPYANVVCGPYYLPQSDLGFYPQYPKVLLGGGVRRRPRIEKVEKTNTCDGAGYETSHTGYDTTMHSAGTNDQQTLTLFPLHPTGILQGRRTGENSSHAAETAENSTTTSTSSETTGVEECSIDQPFFDFFSGRSSCESD